MSSIDNVVALIPSLDPDNHLPEYIGRLIGAGFSKIVIVDDGSSKAHGSIFDELNLLPEVTVLHHEVNRGKGRALKTGFEYILKTYSETDIAGIITADADGQHSAEDTFKCAEKLSKTGCFILGTRDFSQSNVPGRSRFGNTTTTIVFKLLFGALIKDTQTGLRGIPYDFLSTCIQLEGERFDYEIKMLIEIVREKRSIIQEPIETIYFESNRASHFKAIKDSWRIYRIILRDFFAFSLSGIASSIIDISLFAVLTKVVFKALPIELATGLGTVSARAISSVCNYLFNRNAVFKQEGKKGKSLIKYYTLCVCQMLASWLLVVLVYNGINGDTTIIKLFVDVFLFFISFRIQKGWVFA